jgi:hypothetical protein
MDVIMLRDTMGTEREEGARFKTIMKKGTSQHVPVHGQGGGRWLIWRKKARAKTKADAEKVAAKGPLTSADLGDSKGRAEK